MKVLVAAGLGSLSFDSFRLVAEPMPSCRHILPHILSYKYTTHPLDCDFNISAPVVNCVCELSPYLSRLQELLFLAYVQQ